MGLSSCMWTGVSGLINHGQKMNVVGNNIANVNTVGFKSQRMDFQDFMYQNSYSTSGPTQVGRGVKVGIIMGDFSQGAFETTNSMTDLAISGNGFFKVRVPGTEQDYYTRAGNFVFNKAGYLEDPNGFVLQGWAIDNSTAPTRATGGLVPVTNTASQIRGVGTPTDVQLNKWTVSPMQTTQVAFEVKLQTGDDYSSNGANPFASLLDNWNGVYPPANNTPELPQTAYSGNPATIKVYDEAGAAHELSVYFDKVDPSTYADGSSSESVYEYILTMKPEEDMRTIAVPKDPETYRNNPTTYNDFEIVKMNETSAGGVLMAGTLTFDSAGTLKNMSAYVLNGTNKPIPAGANEFAQGNGYAVDTNGDPIPVLDPDNIADYFYPTEISNGGFPLVVANFTGVEGSHTVGSVPDADKYLMEIDFGLKVSDYDIPWDNTNSLGSLAYDPTAPENNNTLYDLVAGVGAISTDGAALAAALTALGKVPELEGTDSNGATQTVDLANDDVESSVIINSDNTDTEYLSLLDVEYNNGADPEYYFRNPDYKPGKNLPPYIYKDQASYNKAYAEAVATALERGAEYTLEQNAQGTYVLNVALQENDWPKTEDLLVKATPPSVDALAGMHGGARIQTNAFTLDATATNNTLISASQNGYGFGDLSSYSIDTAGILYGVYSNGVTLPLYQISLYDFTCEQGLRREGNNLYSQTAESGEPGVAVAGESGFGTVNAQSLESSNVDLSTEFVYMITTQRGFQANSKLITTTDMMLETVITMKR